MKIFLDTNVFFDNWFINSPTFNLLFRYLNNEGVDLLMSDLVLEEAENKRHELEVTSLNKIKKEIRELKKLNPGIKKFDKSELAIKGYNLIELLNDKVESTNRISYGDISHKELVSRVFKSKKPFSTAEKGYRDSLIWLSFIDYLVKNKIEDKVIFITENINDFYRKKGEEISFHPDLQEDLKNNNIKADVVPYKSLYAFVNSEIEKEEHLVENSHLENDLDSFYQDQLEHYLENLDRKELSRLLDTNIFTDKVTQILGIISTTWDGFDDARILNIAELPDSSVYVSCEYTVSGMDITVSIDLIEYNQNKDGLDSIPNILEVDIDKEYSIAKLRFNLARVYVQGSFEYSVKDAAPCSLLDFNSIEI